MLRVLLTVFISLCWETASAEYLIGVGKAEVTGPAAQTLAMGYGQADQELNGIHTRLWARAFLIAHPTKQNQRIVYVNLEALAASQAVSMTVIQRLKEEFGDLYTEANVAINPTHTHTAPGGYLQYFLYSLATAGYVQGTLNAHVGGIVKAIRQAHNSAQLGKVFVMEGELLDASINRSPTAYLNNPPEERQLFAYDTDKTMTQLKFSTHENKDLGLLNWFAVHGTALNNTVSLISGDNKGAASQLFEKYVYRQGRRERAWNASNVEFVAAFAQSNSGDVSPNTEGAFCVDTGLPCDEFQSTCNGRNELCNGRGPGWPDCFASSYEIGRRQFMKARELFQDESQFQELQGDIDSRSIIVNMSSSIVPSESTDGTCRPAMGYSFAAGTSDGPGAFDFVQGQTESSCFWDFVTSLLRRATDRQSACHSPKPFLLDTGEIIFPFPWQPEILQLQILRVGQFIVVCVPGEVTTMAGRRLRSAVQSAVESHWGTDLHIVISGMTNSYSSYITTFEEYQIQRYEGASTIFGPRTLEAYIQEFKRLAEDMVTGRHRENEVQLPDLIEQQWSFSLPVAVDVTPFRTNFGDVRTDRGKVCYSPGETVEVEFWSANPRNSLHSQGHTFLTVERHDLEHDTWVTIATDDDLSTKFAWRPYLGTRLLPSSLSIVSWTIEDDIAGGQYRIGYFGHAKRNLFSSTLHDFQGYSSPFTVSQDCVAPTLNQFIV